MTIDDPGWGEYIPPAESSQPPATGQPPPIGQPPVSGQPGTPQGAGAASDRLQTWLRVPRNRGIAGGVVAAIVLIIVLIVVFSGGGGGSTATTAQFVAKANQTCVNDAPTINSAIATGNTPSIDSAFGSMVSQLQGIGIPSDSASGNVSTWVNDLSAAVSAGQQNNTSAVVSDVQAANLIAQQLGINSCVISLNNSGNT